jgi:RNA polymerase sigma-70 factor (ECF subfamily)
VPTTTRRRTDDVAWDETLRRLRAYIGRRIGDLQVAEDITQDVITRSIAAGALERVDNPIAWLYRSASNAVVDYHRTRRDHVPINESMLDDQPSVGSGEPNDATRELARCVQPMVARLDPIYRDAVAQVDLDGRPQASVARESGVSLSGMKSRVQRGRRQLLTMITECCTVNSDSRGTPTEVTPRTSSADPGSRQHRDRHGARRFAS